MDLLSEIVATKWALGFDFEPFTPTFAVEVVLSVTLVYHEFIRGLEVDQADGAIWHLVVFHGVLLMCHELQAANIALESNLMELLRSSQQSPLNVVNLPQNLSSALVTPNHIPDVLQDFTSILAIRILVSL